MAVNYVKKIDIKKYSIEFIEKCPLFSNCNLKEIIPENVCPFLLHNLVPYFITYSHGGNFTWMKKKGHVYAQCPNPKGKVTVDVINENKDIFFMVKSSRSICLMNYKSGLRISISKIFRAICPSIYDVAFPWMQLGIKDFIKLRCSGCDKHRGVKFILRVRNDKK